MSLEGLFADEAKGLGKSARTRARLMDAAVKLFARDGFEAASVNEIARLAEVANGTFYVHFRDKDQIAATVAVAIGRQVVLRLDQAMAEVEDAVERVSLGSRRFIDLACSQVDWGRALFRAAWTFRNLREEAVGYVRADLRRGAEQGCFTVPIDDVLIDTFLVMTLNAVFGRLQGLYGPEAGSMISELQLRMLGVDPLVAREVAWRAIEPLRL